MKVTTDGNAVSICSPLVSIEVSCAISVIGDDVPLVAGVHICHTKYAIGSSSCSWVEMLNALGMPRDGVLVGHLVTPCRSASSALRRVRRHGQERSALSAAAADHDKRRMDRLTIDV